MVNHSTLCRSIKYDYMNILTWTIMKKKHILNGCETFAFKYKNYWLCDRCDRDFMLKKKSAVINDVKT